MRKAVRVGVILAFAMALSGSLGLAWDDDVTTIVDQAGTDDVLRWFDRAHNGENGHVELPVPVPPISYVENPTPGGRIIIQESAFGGGLGSSFGTGGSLGGSSQQMKDARNVKNLIRRLG